MTNNHRDVVATLCRTPLSEVRHSKLPIHPIFLIAPLALAAWVIALAGLSARTKDCGDSSSTSYCGVVFGLNWMAIAFQAVIFIAVVAIVPTKFCTHARYFLAAILTILSVLHMLFTQDALLSIELGLSGSYKSAVQAYAAGAIMLIIADLLLIAYLVVDVDYNGVQATANRKAVGTAAPGTAPEWLEPEAPQAPTAPGVVVAQPRTVEGASAV